MKRYQNLVMMIAVVMLVAIPLLMVQKPAPGQDGKEIEIFSGADGQAKELIGKIVPDYKPWATSLMEPPSGEIESLLFALQAALGAGFIGYWYGSAATRAKMRRETNNKAAQC
ncbi:MAG: energy-coupling factor ABC transporter substrate-binding protein [Desulfobacteraceae bacterium]|jgi:cobalt/nickel transport protein|nr:MAG: energy-coupling factor ABC transporter substrate-binding protein [Desulfobacteraceae bacterium]